MLAAVQPGQLVRILVLKFDSPVGTAPSRNGPPICTGPRCPLKGATGTGYLRKLRALPELPAASSPVARHTAVCLSGKGHPTSRCRCPRGIGGSDCLSGKKLVKGGTWRLSSSCGNVVHRADPVPAYLLPDIDHNLFAGCFRLFHSGCWGAYSLPPPRAW